MSLTSFCGRHPLVALLALSFLICGSAALAGTRIQGEMDRQAVESQNNPHHIPENMDPKSQSLSEEISLIKYEVREEVAQAPESIHSIAFQGNHGQSQSILDYTTGTTN